jgi:hypothetical protein
MSGGGLSIAARAGATTASLLQPFDRRPIPQTLIKREAAPRRTKIWEFNTNLHCSIIGTCLSGAELRQVLRKVGVQSQGTDHELHGVAVTLAGRHDDPARQLHKALDHRHKLSVSQFNRANSEDALRSMWRDAVKRGDIPGAYWATLTHPHANQAIVREAFGEVHMLSHLVGSANRADIRRLCVLEQERSALESKLERQQHALRQAVLERDDQIRELRQALADRIVSGTSTEASEDSVAMRSLVADLRRRLAVEASRNASLADRLAAAEKAAARERTIRIEVEGTADALRRELEATEAALTPVPSTVAPDQTLDGIVLLYVGGRPNQLAPMRDLIERRGGTLLHHDGGLENHPTLLPGLTSRADMVLFPVDCISHDAAQAVKALCQQAGKRFVPLRSSSITSLAAALQTTAAG